MTHQPATYAASQVEGLMRAHLQALDAVDALRAEISRRADSYAADGVTCRRDGDIDDAIVYESVAACLRQSLQAVAKP